MRVRREVGARTLVIALMAPGSLVPAVASGQRAPVVGHLTAPSVLPGAPSSYRAPLCDGSRVEAARSKHRRGTVLLWGGAATSAVGLATVSRAGGTSTASGVLGVVGAGVALGGLVMRRSAANAAAYSDDDIARIKTGETRTQDVEGCLGRPSSTSSSGNEEIWTYSGAKPGMFSGGSGRVVMITFRNGIVTDVRRTVRG
jgi:hypothetical protein